MSYPQRQQPGPYHRQPVQTPPKKSRTLMWVLLSILVISLVGCSGLFFALVAGGNKAEHDFERIASSPRIDVPAATAKPQEQAQKPKPGEIPGDGTFRVGVDIQPGQYKTVVPTSSIDCYWVRMKGTSGTLDDIIANDNVSPGSQAVVTILNQDKAFQTRGCGIWQKIG